ncbi:Uncharacterised protein [uncultured archaeon]|nr:Uncharacterised protein [uncultured archaeon]
MRPVSSAEGQVQEEWLIRLQGFAIAYVLYRLVHQILGEVVTLLRRGWRTYAGGAGNQIRVPLAGVGLQEPIEPLESPAHGPLVVRPCSIDSARRCQMPFAHAIGIIPLLDQHLGHGGRLFGQVSCISGVA